MGKGTIKKRIAKILEEQPLSTLEIMAALKKYKDCPTTNQIASMLPRHFQEVGESPSSALGSSHKIKVWSLKEPKQKECV